jgi:PAS domain S-box-containing protein
MSKPASAPGNHGSRFLRTWLLPLYLVIAALFIALGVYEHDYLAGWRKDSISLLLAAALFLALLVIIARKREEEVIRQRTLQLQLLYETSQRLNHTLELNQIYQETCNFMSLVAPNDCFAISAFDPATKLITCSAYFMENKRLDVSDFPSIPLEEEGKGTQSIVIRTGQSLLIDDYQARMKTTQTSYYVSDETNQIVNDVPPDEDVTRSALIVPLKIGGTVKGAIQVMSYRLSAFDESQLRMLEALALHVASAEQNAILYAQVQAELSERRQAEAALFEERDRLGLAVDATGLGMYDWNPKTGAVIYSELWAAMFGYRLDELQTSYTAWSERVHPDDMAVSRRATEDAFRDGTPYRCEYRMRHRDGSWRWILDQGRVVGRDDQGEVIRFVGANLDITEHKRAESQISDAVEEVRRLNETLEARVAERTELLEAANEKLAESSRDLLRSNTELEQFAHAVSHDLQEPLRSVVGFAQLLEKRLAGKLDAENGDFMKYVVDGTLRMRKLIDDILAYSRVGSRYAVLQPVDASLVVQEVLFLLDSKISSTGAQIEVLPLPTIAADRTQLLQMFQNLIGNAIKFCKEGVPRVRIEAGRDGAHWRFTITDNGIGIADEYRARVFEMFQRLHTQNEYDGTGIGLAICKRIIQRHGGEIGVDAAPGGGSIFWFTFPAE